MEWVGVGMNVDGNGNEWGCKNQFPVVSNLLYLARPTWNKQPALRLIGSQYNLPYFFIDRQ